LKTGDDKEKAAHPKMRGVFVFQFIAAQAP
jgi:hypothetical protein